MSGVPLAVVGAGPKGLAIAAKAWALRLNGLEVPPVQLIDRHGVAASWDGRHGYTDGEQRLGTPPDKDLAFPFAPSWGAASEQVHETMRQLTWAAYLQSQDRYTDWIDRRRPQPSHYDWYGYLIWAARLIGADVLRAEVREVDLFGGTWRLRCESSSGAERKTSCGLVLTGSGPPLRVPQQPREHPRVFDGRSFWPALDGLARGEEPVEACVVGAGETAAAVTEALWRRLPRGSMIEVVTPLGVLYTRGESFGENSSTRSRSRSGVALRYAIGASSSAAPTGACSRCRPSGC